MQRTVKPMMKNFELKQLKVKTNPKNWYMFPDVLPMQRFKGFENREDKTQNRGAFPIGQNVTFNSARIPTLRQGYEVLGTEITDQTPVSRAWRYETRDGVQYILKYYDTRVDYFLIGVSTDFSLLLDGLTPGLEMGFANIGKTSEATMYTLFCNGEDSWYKFSGAYATVSGTTANTISMASGTFTALGFNPGTSTVVANGVVYTYTGGEGTNTLTGVTPDPSGLAVGTVFVQAPEAVSSLNSVKGDIIMAHDGRVHANLYTKPTIWDYSKLDDYSDWSAGNSDGDGGAKEVEFGGPITSFGKLNQVALCFKNRIIKTLSFNQVGERLDSPVYTTLIPADDKGTTLGAVNQRSTFSTPQGLVFVTPDKRLVLLTGITANNQPQYLFLSDQIQPVVNDGVHDQATGICVDNIIWYSFKSSPQSTFNDVVLRGDMTRQSTTSDGKVLPVEWDTPYVGWNVNDFTVHFDQTLGENVVVWHSSINSNSYKIIASKTDNSLPFTSILRSWAETFDIPQTQKKVDYVFVEIYMTENTELHTTLLYDEDGITGREEYTLLGTSTNNSFYADSYNPYGASPYGVEKMGSNPENPALRKYRFMIETPNNLWFYNLSIQFATTEDGNDFELIRFGYHMNEVIEQTDSKILTGV